MSTIEVTCQCGRVYVLPGDKEGRKLQCRRCGSVISIRRDAEPGVVVPFRTPTDDDDDEGTKVDAPPRSASRAPAPKARSATTRMGGPAPPAPARGGWPGKLELKPLENAREPLRRCPRCGLQDDPSIVICIRCSFDFRDGLPAPAAATGGSGGAGGPASLAAAPASLTAPAAGEGAASAPTPKALGRPSTTRITKAELGKAERAHDERITRVETLAKISFVPLAGVVTGLMALGLSLVGNGPLREMPAPSRKALESRLAAARLMALATLLIWLGVVAFYAFVYVPQQKQEIRENLANTCRGHLESLGRWLNEARGAKGRFPADPKRTLADGVRDLADKHDLADVLLCPLPGAERYTIDGGLAAISATTNRDYLILWDSVPHPETGGKLRWFALRADGITEEFGSSALFEKARSRPSEAGGRGTSGSGQGGAGGNGTGTPGDGGEPRPGDPRPGDPKGNDPKPGETRPSKPAPAETFEPRRAALIQLGKELDGTDPKLEKTLSDDEFTKRVGLTPGDAVVQVMRYGDDDLRHVAARLVARLAVPAPELLRLAEQLQKEADPETRWTLVLGLKRAGAPAWLDACAALATETLPPTSEQALALLAEEARSGKEGLKRVLLRARDRRELSKTGSDQPIFALPADIYQTVAELLGDREVGAEALGVLSRGGPEIEKVIDPLFANADPRLREQAFRALRSSLAWREAPRAPLHDRYKAETDRSVKAAVLPLLLDTIDAETMKRALEGLREATGDPLAAAARKVLAGAKDREALVEMLRELDRPGASRDEVLSELRKSTRVVDDAVSEVLYQKGLSLQAAGQEAAIALAFARIDDVSHRFLVRVASESTITPAREAAWKLLIEGARYSDKIRSEIQDEVVTRLSKEPEPTVKTHILNLLGRYEFRTPATVTALESLARKSNEPIEIRERAVVALSQSTDPRAITSLADVVDSLKEHAKYVATVKLKELTGSSNQPQTSAEWRKILKSSETELKRKLRERDEKERGEFRDRQEQAEARARDLRPRSP